MATLEQSLVLHDKFSNKLESINRVLEVTLRNFERLQSVASRGVSFNVNNNMSSVPLGIPQVQPFPQPEMKKMNLEMQADQVLSELEFINNEADLLINKMDEVSSALVEAFSSNKMEDANRLRDSYENMYQELMKVQTQAENTGRALGEIEAKRTNANPVGEGNLAPPTTRTAYMKMVLDDKPAMTTIQKVQEKLNSLGEKNINPFKGIGNHSQGVEVTINSMIEGIKNKFNSLDSAIVGKAQGMSEKLSTAFNKVPIINTLTSSISALKERIEATGSASSRMNDSMSRVSNNTQQYSATGRSIQFLQKTFDGLASRILGVKKSNDSLNDSMSRVSRNAKNFTLIGSTLGVANRYAQNLWKSLIGVDGASNKIVSSVAKIPSFLGRAASSAQELANKMMSVKSSGGAMSRVANLMTFQLAIQGLRTMSNLMDNLTSKADTYINTMNRLKIANDGSEAVDEFNDKIMAAAVRSRSAYGDMSESVARFAINARDAFETNDEVITFAESLNKLYKIGGASVQEQQGSMIQLTQAMARGVLRGEELNSVWEQGPLIIQKIADFLDVPMGKLKEMADEGMITADIVKAAILSSAEDITNQFNEMDMTFGQMVENFKTMSIGAFKPLIESWNEFVNSAIGQQIFEQLIYSVFLFAEVVTWAFNEIAIPALQWLANNIQMVTTAITIMGIIAVTYAIAMAVAWAIANWQIVLFIAVIGMVIYILDAMGITADQVLGWIAYGVMFLGTVFYNAFLFIAASFQQLMTFFYNAFAYLWNIVASVAEFFANVWKHPILSVKNLFKNMISNVLNWFASMAEGSAGAADALGNAFVAGVNTAINAVNWLIEAINKIPGINIGTLSNVDQFRSGGVASTFRSAANALTDTSNDPDDYWRAPTMDIKPMDQMANSFGNMKNPFDMGMKGYEGVTNFFSGAGNKMDEMMSKFDKNNMNQESLNKDFANMFDPSDFGGGGGDGGKGGGSGGKGKKPNIGTVDKIKDTIDISQEDLKYLRDIAEKDFVVKFQQLEPSATVNFESTGNTEEDARRLLELMEQMILDMSAKELYS